MHPYLSLGPLTISTFGLLTAIGWLVGLFLFWLYGRQEVPDEEALLDLAVLASAGGLVLARLVFILSRWNELGVVDWFRLFSRPGLDWQGFLLGFFVIMYRFTQSKKWSFWRMADLLSLPLLIAEAFGRIGCHLNGCLIGKLTSLPWGVFVAGYPGKRHPLALYQSVLAILILGFLLKRKVKSHFAGYLVWWYMVLTGLGQTLLAVWQEDQLYLGRVPVKQLIWLMIGIWFLIFLYQKEKIQWQKNAVTYLARLSGSFKNIKSSIFRKKQP